jgi:diadenosine tetraphosphate (Ap4A) HIT family hydrolase
VCRVRSGWVALGDPQILPGYCLLYPDPVVADLHILSPPARTQFLGDLGLLGEAVMQLTGARRINYEMLGNVEPALHAHVIPRYETEAPHLRSKPIWSYDWDAAPRFDPVRDASVRDALHRALQGLGAIAFP